MCRLGASSARILWTAVFASLVWWGAACGSEQTKAPQQTPAARGVTLEAELHHEGLVALRSPTFR